MARQSIVWSVLAVLLCVAVLVSACGSPILPEPQRRPTATVPERVYTPTVGINIPTPMPTLPLPSAYQEAPALKSQVEQGVLPPVNERLPINPKVVRVVNEIGQYGGTWDMVIQSTADEAQFIRTVTYEPLLRWTPDWSNVEPNLVESYSTNRSVSEFTFNLRQGVRWSDGEPFTTRDIQFWYEDILLNPSLTPIIPIWLKSGSGVAQFAFIDDYTFTVKFALPNTLFLRRLATPDALVITAYPAHYAEQFHEKYARPDSLDKLVSTGNYPSWVEMFISRVGVTGLDSGSFADIGRPRLSAWIPKTAYNQGYSEINWDRNPYYWKVDAQGNQLPYIDTVVFHAVDSVDETIMRVIDGQIDMQNLGPVGDEIFARLGGGDDQYRFYRLIDGSNNVMVFYFNLAHPDPLKRELFQNRDFRAALSLAINRQEIIDQVFGGEGEPWQAAPRTDSPFYDNELATQYTDYDVDQANALLDDAEFVKDSLGRRLDTEGNPISFVVFVPDSEPEQMAILNLIAREWSRLGISVTPKAVPLPIFQATVRSNLHDAAVWRGGATFFEDVLLDPSNYLPVGENTLWAVTWSNWYNKVPGYEEVRPLNPAQMEMSMYDRIRVANSISEQLRLMKAALMLARDNFWTIGIALGPERYGIAKSSFKNVPEQMPSAWLYPDPGPANPEQFYILSNRD